MRIQILIVATLMAGVAGQTDGEGPPATGSAAAWANACVTGLVTSGFDFLKTEKYDLWYNETSIMQLAQTGTFIGPEEMAEYVNFVRGPFFDFYTPVPDEGNQIPVKLTQDECVMMVAITNKMQVNANMGKPVCVETTVGFKIHYTVADLGGSGFLIHRTNVYYNDMFAQELFGDALYTDGVRDYICDNVLMANCPDTVALNGLTSESCKQRYDALPNTRDGYLDEYTTGCRILHSAFAKLNEKHCPHLSFVPEVDYKNQTKCQKSYGTVPEDLFTADELAFLQTSAAKYGQDNATGYKTCEYEPVEDENSDSASNGYSVSSMMYFVGAALVVLFY